MFFALFGIDDGALNLVVNLLVLFLVSTWLALIYWTYRDAKQRIEDPVLIVTAAAASVIPFAGTVVYTILRPPEYLEDARERQLETEAAGLRVRQLREQSCPNCEHPISRDFLRCPSCQARLKDPCSSCSQPVDPRWTMCPFCETALRTRERRPAPAQRKPTRRADGQTRSQSTQPPAPTKSSSQPPTSRNPGSRAALGGSGRTSSSAPADRERPSTKRQTDSDAGMTKPRQPSSRPSSRRDDDRPDRPRPTTTS